MKPSTMRIGLAAALALTVAAAWFAPADEPQQTTQQTTQQTNVAPASRAAPLAAAAAAAASAPAAFLDVLAIRSRRSSDDDGAAVRLFDSTEWTPAPAAASSAQAVAPAEPPAPQLPPLPFKVLGSHQQAGQTVLFLQQNDTNHVVRVGDTIAGTYKVERLEGATLTLRYLPMDQVQTLDLGRTLQESEK